MDNNQTGRNTPYEDERSTTPNRETGNINDRNNNVEVSSPGAIEPDVEGASNAGIGDAAVNDQKLTRYTSNHSGDA